VDVADVEFDGVEDDALHDARGRIVIDGLFGLGAALEALVGLDDGFARGDGRQDAFGKDGTRLLLIVQVQDIGKSHDDLVLLSFNGYVVRLVSVCYRNLMQQGDVKVGESGIDERVAKLHGQSFQELEFLDEIVVNQDFAQFLRGRAGALDLKGGFKIGLADQSEFQKEAADAHGQLVLADGGGDLIGGYVAELLDDFEQRLGPDELCAQPGSVERLFFREEPFLDQDVDEFAVGGWFDGLGGILRHWGSTVRVDQ